MTSSVRCEAHDYWLQRKGLGGLLVNYSYEYLHQFTKNLLSEPEEEVINTTVNRYS